MEDKVGAFCKGHRARKGGESWEQGVRTELQGVKYAWRTGGVLIRAHLL